MTHLVGALGSGSASESGTQGSLLLGLLDHLLAARGSLLEFGIDALFAGVRVVELLTVNAGDLFLDLLVVGLRFFSRIDSQSGRASQLFVNLELLGFGLTLLLLDTGLSSVHDLQVVLLGFLLDLAEMLTLALGGIGKLLGKSLLNLLLLGFFDRVAPLADQEHSLANFAGTFAALGDDLNALGFSGLLPLAKV